MPRNPGRSRSESPGGCARNAQATTAAPRDADRPAPARAPFPSPEGRGRRRPAPHRPLHRPCHARKHQDRLIQAGGRGRSRPPLVHATTPHSYANPLAGLVVGRGGRAREADRRNESHSLRLGTCLTVRPVPRHRQSSDRAGRFLHGRSCWCRLASPPAVVWHRLRPVGALPRYRFGLGPRGLSAVGRWRGRPGSRTEADFSRRINRPNPSRRIWRMVAAIGMRASCCPSLARWTRPPAGR
jgi:hypothetical protein